MVKKLHRCNSIVYGRSCSLAIFCILLLFLMALPHVARKCCNSNERYGNDWQVKNNQNFGKSNELLLMQNLFAAQSEERRRLLLTNRTKYELGLLYNVLVPEVFCPYLVRVGSVLDGGKWVCNPFHQPSIPCSIYSFGINNEPSFDEQIQQLTNYRCNLYSYDEKSQTNETIVKLRSVNGIFQIAKLGIISNASLNEFTIFDLLQINGDEKIEMLKMDIEGDEFVVMPDILAAIEICQIFIEMHRNPRKMINVLRSFSLSGFYLFSYEVNGYDSKGCEFSFIHKSCMKKYGVDVILGRYLQ